MKLYFAGPLFSNSEKEYNLKLTEKIESTGYEVFLPQRDGLDKDLPLHKSMTPEEKNKEIFLMDRDKIFRTDIFLFVMDGRVPDEGASVALGMAYTQKFLDKKNTVLIGLHTDLRASFLDSKLNPMLCSPLDYLISTEKELLDLLRILRLKDHGK